MKLPLGLSVPHAGLWVPRRYKDRCLLSPAQLAADGDLGAREVYDLRGHVRAFVTTAVARAVLDINRAPDDVGRPDGVVKTVTIWEEPVWREPLSDVEVRRLLRRFHAPYHRALTGFAGRVRLGIDCHTMSDVGPPIGPDPGARRPFVCLGHVGGASCPRGWVEALRDCFARRLGAPDEVTIDRPFAGGYVTRTHGGRLPWVQLELSRGDFLSLEDKRALVLGALRDWCALDLPLPDSWRHVAC